ncbi:major facilitator superfamily domain-containing protein [Mycena galopus ATCC 62051]|nr:major facilitator superfamily domain-containing protein [Mycena galopus ATCC 62051]
MILEISPGDEKKNGGASDILDPIIERTVWLKLDRWILPVITIFYLLSFLDRTNIGNAPSHVAGLQTHLNMSNKEYTIAVTLTYVGYVASELPSNLVLKRIGPSWDQVSIFLPTIMILWGLVATLQGVVTNYHGLLAYRSLLAFSKVHFRLVCYLVLGQSYVFSGGVSGIVLYLSLFYTRQRLQTRIVLFFSAASISGAFSRLLALGIIHLDGKRGYSSASWIFLIEGALTISCGLAAFFILPSSPISARFLTEKEKVYLGERLREDRVMCKDPDVDAFSWSEVARAFTSVQVVLVGITYFLNGVALYGLAYFTPSIVQSLGYISGKAQLMSVPPFAVSAFVTVVAALISDFYKCRGAVAIGGSVLCLAGFGLFLGSSNRHVQYGSLFLSIPGTYLTQPALAAWNANNSAPYIRRATTMAIGFMMTNSGGILATWLFGDISPPPRYEVATKTLLIFSVLMGLLCALNMWYLSAQNRGKAKARGNAEPPVDSEKLGDRSPWFVYSM